MKSTTVRIAGDNLSNLSDRLLEKLGGSVRYAIGRVHVIVTEKPDKKGKSNLMTTVVLDFSVPGECTVDVVSGGGSPGLLGKALGGDTGDTESTIDLLQEICRSHGWDLFEENKKEKEEDGFDWGD